MVDETVDEKDVQLVAYQGSMLVCSLVDSLEMWKADEMVLVQVLLMVGMMADQKVEKQADHQAEMMAEMMDARLVDWKVRQMV